MSFVQKALIIICCHVSVSLAQSPSFRDKWSFDLGPSVNVLYIRSLSNVGNQFMGFNFATTANYHITKRHRVGVGANFFWKKDKQTYIIAGNNETYQADFMSTGLRLRYQYGLSNYAQVSLGVLVPFWEQYDVAYFSDSDYWEAKNPEFEASRHRLTMQYGVPLSFHLKLMPYLTLDFGIIGYITAFKYTDLKDYEDKHAFFFATVNTGLKYSFGQAVKYEHTNYLSHEK